MTTFLKEMSILQLLIKKQARWLFLAVSVKEHGLMTSLFSIFKLITGSMLDYREVKRRLVPAVDIQQQFTMDRCISLLARMRDQKSSMTYGSSTLLTNSGKKSKLNKEIFPCREVVTHLMCMMVTLSYLVASLTLQKS